MSVLSAFMYICVLYAGLLLGKVLKSVLDPWNWKGGNVSHHMGVGNQTQSSSEQYMFLMVESLHILMKNS